MKRRFRLTKTADFQRVRNYGKSISHPLIVLIYSPNHLNISRFGVSASRSVGKAVARNRAKRLMRSSLRDLIQVISPGWDVLLIARKPISGASFHQTRDALTGMLTKAKLILEINEV